MFDSLSSKLWQWDYSISLQVYTHLNGVLKYKRWVEWITIGFGAGPLTLLVLLVSDNRINSLLFCVLYIAIIGIIVELVIKQIVRRPRPSYHHPPAYNFSFPSAHASGSTGLFLYLYIISEVNWLVLVPALVWSILVILSRMGMGKHYVSDILGGIVTGGLIFSGFYWLSTVI